MAYIDGYHFYGAVRHDFFATLRITSKKFKILFDDYYSDDPESEFIDDTGVFVNFPDYDHGLPGSGILIWHIKEPSTSGLFDGINNDRYNKAVTLEEGDGMYN